MKIKKIMLSERYREAMLSRGFELLMKQGYEETDMELLAGELNIPWEEVSAAYRSKEDYYLEALQYMMLKSCEEFRFKRGRASSYRKAYAVYRMDLMQLQTEPFISSMYAFYDHAETDQIRRFWKIVEDYARTILELLNKGLSQQNIKTFIYCLSMIFSKNMLVMHDAPAEIVCGCGNVESDILFREIKAMRDISKTGEEEMRADIL